jgi:hypothetical protein
MSIQRWAVLVLVIGFGTGACGSNPLSSVTTGLTGTVVRGPVTPVCQTGVSCDAPFSADFTVWIGARRASTFRSDEQGRFTVKLEPGTYEVVPGPDAPILMPQSQVKSVTVSPDGLTPVRLEFDTGIR